MAAYTTEQEEFWAGEFGSKYIDRNPTDFEIAGRTALFSKIFARTEPLSSIIEFGANIGNNLKVINRLFPNMVLAAVEINKNAATELRKWDRAQVYEQSLFEFLAEKQRDMAFVSGVLIHLAPELLAKAYEVLYKASRRYICLIEYYNPSPVEIPYRGHSGKLFKRDFAGEMMDCYGDLRLVDYGFVYHRDPQFPLDDLSWFLMEKRGEI